MNLIPGNNLNNRVITDKMNKFTSSLTKWLIISPARHGNDRANDVAIR